MSAILSMAGVLAASLSSIPGNQISSPSQSESTSITYLEPVPSNSYTKIPIIGSYQLDSDPYENYDHYPTRTTAVPQVLNWDDWDGGSFGVYANRKIEQNFHTDWDDFRFPLMSDCLVTISVQSPNPLYVQLNDFNDFKGLPNPSQYTNGYAKLVHESIEGLTSNSFQLSFELSAGAYGLSFSTYGTSLENQNCSFSYTVRIGIQPRIRTNVNAYELKYRYGVNGLYWMADGKPFGLSNSTPDNIYRAASSGAQYSDAYPTEAYATNGNQPVLYSRLYLWNPDLRNSLSDIMTGLHAEVSEQLEAAKQYELNLKKIRDGVEVVETAVEITSLVLQFIPFGGTIADAIEIAIDAVSQAAFSLAYALIDDFMPDNIESLAKYKTYLLVLASVLECTDPNAFETVMISTYYKADATGLVDFTVTYDKYDSITSHKWQPAEIPCWPSDSPGPGKFSYVFADFDGSFSYDEFSTELGDPLPFSPVCELELGHDAFLNSLKPYEWLGYEFTAPESGAYSISSSVSVGLKATVKSLIQNYSTWENKSFVRESTDASENGGLYCDFYLLKNEKVQITLEGKENLATTGASNLRISNTTPHHADHHYRVSCVAFDSSKHKWNCWCGASTYQSHVFDVSNILRRTCKACGYTQNTGGGILPPINPPIIVH